MHASPSLLGCLVIHSRRLQLNDPRSVPIQIHLFLRNICCIHRRELVKDVHLADDEDDPRSHATCHWHPSTALLRQGPQRQEQEQDRRRSKDVSAIAPRRADVRRGIHHHSREFSLSFPSPGPHQILKQQNFLNSATKCVSPASPSSLGLSY